MNEKLDGELDKGRRHARRNWARMSFYFILGTGMLTAGRLLFSEDRAEIATALVTAAPVLNTFVTVCVTVVLGYLGASHMDKRLENGDK
jgi:hypothetical protein